MNLSSQHLGYDPKNLPLLLPEQPGGTWHWDDGQINLDLLPPEDRRQSLANRLLNAGFFLPQEQESLS